MLFRSLVSVEQTDIPADTQNSQGEGEEKTQETGVIYVDVCGHVKNPGVYQLTEDSRVYEAIDKAGGMTEEASASLVNQAERLIDGQQIYVPSEDEQAYGSGNAAYPAAKDTDNGKVNLNTASKEQLLSLTGIGDVKADSIIRYREENGSFRSVEDIKKIEGIKDGVFNKIKDQITV